jgi:hypothetical protein
MTKKLNIKSTWRKLSKEKSIEERKDKPLLVTCDGLHMSDRKQKAKDRRHW